MLPILIGALLAIREPRRVLSITKSIVSNDR